MEALGRRIQKLFSGSTKLLRQLPKLVRARLQSVSKLEKAVGSRRTRPYDPRVQRRVAHPRVTRELLL